MGSAKLVGLGGAGLCPDFADISALCQPSAPTTGNVVIVEGDPGPDGKPGGKGNLGAPGLDSFTTTTSTFVVPAVGSTATAPVVSSERFAVGQPVFMESAGYFTVDTKPDAFTLRLLNPGAAGNVIPNAGITKNKRVIGAGMPGPDGVTPVGLATAFLAVQFGTGDGGGKVFKQYSDQTRTGYYNSAHGPLTEIFDPADIVIPITEPMWDRDNPNPFLHEPVGFYLAAGTYHIRVRQPAFGVHRFCARLKIGSVFRDVANVPFLFENPIANPGVIQGITGAMYGQSRLTAGYSDSSNTLQGKCYGDFLVTGGPGVAVWIVFICERTPVPAANANYAMGLPCNFAAEDEIYTTVKVRQLSRP